MSDETQFRHLGGGRKGLFLLLRYLFIVAASYLLIFQAKAVDTTPAVMIAVALLSNVVLSMLPSHYVFAWYVEAPVMVADTLWVSWALHSTGSSGGQEFFLLYFFVLFLAALGESLMLVMLGSTLVSIANVYFSDGATMWTAAALLRIVFFYTVALFYGHVLGQIKRERQRADRRRAHRGAPPALQGIAGREPAQVGAGGQHVARASHPAQHHPRLQRDAPRPGARR
jgi:hypothetical protein